MENPWFPEAMICWMRDLSYLCWLTGGSLQKLSNPQIRWVYHHVSHCWNCNVGNLVHFGGYTVYPIYPVSDVSGHANVTHIDVLKLIILISSEQVDPSGKFHQNVHVGQLRQTWEVSKVTFNSHHFPPQKVYNTKIYRNINSSIPLPFWDLVSSGSFPDENEWTWCWSRMSYICPWCLADPNAHGIKTCPWICSSLASAQKYVNASRSLQMDHRCDHFLQLCVSCAAKWRNIASIIQIPEEMEFLVANLQGNWE